jgi:hypothetical protein
MTRFIGALAIILICVGLLGYFLGWFTFSVRTTSQDGTLTGTVNKEKIRADEEKAKDAIHKAGEAIKDEVKSLKKK